jgi:hypothetical protein
MEAGIRPPLRGTEEVNLPGSESGAWRCIACGNVVDQVILRNKRVMTACVAGKNHRVELADVHEVVAF